MLPYCDDIMQAFVEILRNPDVDKSIKPTVFTSFGSIALSIGPAFEKYLPIVMTLMREAATVQLPENTDEETFEYMTELRSEIMSSYACILNGMHDNHRSAQLQPYVQGIFEVIQMVANLEEDEDVMNHTVGLIGDLAEVFGVQIGALINQYNQGIEKCLNGSDDEGLQTFCRQKMTLATNGGGGGGF